MSSAVTPVAQKSAEQLSAVETTEAHDISPEVATLVKNLQLVTPESGASRDLKAAVVAKSTKKMEAVVKKHSNFPIASPKPEAPPQNPAVQTITGDVRDLSTFHVLFPQVKSLTITGCPNLTSLGLQARLYNIQTLVLENLPLLAPSSLSDITKALPYGGMPGLKQFTIKKCPLMNDDTCIDIARMINQGLAQLVMEGLPLVTFKGINHIKKNIWHNVGKLEIQTVSMRDPRIQGNEYPKFRRSYFNLLAYVDANVQRMPTWKLLPGNDDQMPGKRAELTESDYQKPPADSSESDYESDSKMPPGKNLSDSDGELDVDY